MIIATTLLASAILMRLGDDFTAFASSGEGDRPRAVYSGPNEVRITWPTNSQIEILVATKDHDAADRQMVRDNSLIGLELWRRIGPDQIDAEAKPSPVGGVSGPGDTNLVLNFARSEAEARQWSADGRTYRVFRGRYSGTNSWSVRVGDRYFAFNNAIPEQANNATPGTQPALLFDGVDDVLDLGPGDKGPTARGVLLWCLASCASAYIVSLLVELVRIRWRRARS